MVIIDGYQDYCEDESGIFNINIGIFDDNIQMNNKYQNVLYSSVVEIVDHPEEGDATSIDILGNLKFDNDDEWNMILSYLHMAKVPDTACR